MSQITAETLTDSNTANSIRDRIADRIGVGASVLCAIHCAVTPFLLLLLPTFGKAWSHPATHWGMALLVVPLAGLMIRSGYKKHRRNWIVAAGALGILFVLTGAAAPYLEETPESSGAVAAVGNNKEGGGDAEEACECCTDNCCPSIQETADGSWTMHIPTASILTTLGGAFLIVTHIGNLRLCSCASCVPSEAVEA